MTDEQQQPEPEETASTDEVEPTPAGEAQAAAGNEPAAAATPKPRRARRAKAEAEPDAPAKAEPEATEDAPAPAKRRTRRTPAPAEPASPATAPRAARAPGSAPPVVRAQARYVRSSARKARMVCEHIRGKPVPEARAALAFSPRAVARDWSKLLESAIANAEHNHELVGDELRVLTAFADEGPTLKRFRPRAMGRATKIRKRTSHLTITLTPKE